MVDTSEKQSVSMWFCLALFDFGAYEIQDYQPASDAHSRVSYVENVEFYASYIDKINDVSAKDPVDHVADSAADYQSQRKSEKTAFGFFADKVDDEQNYCCS